MVYFGGFTFDRENPTTHLKIPNAVAAQRIAEVILERYRLSQSLPVALQALLQDGDIEGVLSCYRDVMTDRDVTKKELTATTEENHRDSLNYCLLRNTNFFHEWNSK